ncbi:MAG: hypothetical protein A2Y67_00990 [Candidatus Buchananbacteria bacterium RBG_13_39_9]|uniref:N-formylglutamate amidohydrolase n=1 Tax=Candidatus Buchananbacteria bacterium RBG_13_39_9 TaxID=1797531 RepID=A0A1G1XNC3_9BACT|nr:MAG: hypothetical protein A2Y67_00990 [Candidatus Buchananbacteria bacterium RBG_13_39_9]
MIVISKEYKRTKYGFKKKGQSPFVIIAPHAAGDDLKTGLIARRLAKKLNAFLVINNKFFKSTNSKAKTKPEFVQDFNKLGWGYKNRKYFWWNKKRPMRAFYSRIAKYCDLAKSYSREKKAVAIYLHGTKENEIGIDIGVGIKTKKFNDKFIKSSESNYFCSGVPTIEIDQAKELKKLLQSELLKKYGLKVGIGCHFPAWSKRIAVQFHKNCGRDDYAIQLEINKTLRQNKKDRLYLAYLLSEVLKQIFI